VSSFETPPPPADPVARPCVNHPNTLTYISCSRCGNAICPACMTQAPVGQQCPDCVNEGKRTVRQARTVLGGRAISRPTVTYTLLIMNVIVFVITYVTGHNAAIDKFGMQPIEIAVNHQYYRLFTSVFMHENIAHIGFNMLVLWIIGQQLEALLGHSRFIVLYLISGFAGAVASFWFSPIGIVGIGASGAIFGLMGGLLVAGRRLRYDVTQVAVLIGINLVIGFVLAGTDWRAHLGGLAGGLAVGAVFAHGPKKNRLVFEIASCVVIVAILVGLTLLRSSHIAALHLVPVFS
jgi:membrane associated rhomboid family serine protease